jgi:hypothetical protein
MIGGMTAFDSLLRARIAGFCLLLISAALAGLLPMPAVAEAPEWRWRLSGIIVGPDLREALFTLGSETRAIREGRPIDGWILAAVRPDSVTLTGADETKVLGPEELASGAGRAPDTDGSLQAARAVAAAAAEQQRQQQVAESVLADATKVMMINGGNRRKRARK